MCKSKHIEPSIARLGAALIFLAGLACSNAPAAEPKSPPDLPAIVLQTGHTAPIAAVAFSADGQRLVTGSIDGSAILWDPRAGRQLRTLRSPGDPISSVAVSPDGKQAAILAGESVFLTDLRTGKAIREMKLPLAAGSVVFSPDGKRLAVGILHEPLISLWDMETAKQIGILKGCLGSRSGQFAPVFSPNSKLLATASPGGGVDLWDADTGRKIHELFGLRGRWNVALCMAFRPDGKSLVAGYSDNMAALWNVETGTRHCTLVGHRRPILAVAFSADGKQVLTSSEDGTATVWDPRIGEEVFTFRGGGGGISAAAFVQDGRQIVTQSTGVVEFQSVATGRRICVIDDPNADGPTAVGPDGRRLITCRDNGAVVFWDTLAHQKLRTLGGKKSPSFVEMGFIDKQFVTGSFDSAAILWDATTGHQIQRVAPNSESRVLEPRRPPPPPPEDDPFAPLPSPPPPAMVPPLAKLLSCRKQRTFDGRDYWLESLAYSADGKRIALGVPDAMIVWNAETGKTIPMPLAVQSCFWVPPIALSSDGKMLATGSWGNDLILWSTLIGEDLYTLDGHKDLVNAVAFTPDGKKLISGSRDHTAIIWDTGTGKPLHTLIWHSAEVLCVAVSPDGKLIATGSADNTAILWDAQSGNGLRTLDRRDDLISSVKFSEDGRFVFVASRDGAAGLVEAATGKTILTLCAFNSGNDWLVYSPDGYFDGTEGGRKLFAIRAGPDNELKTSEQLAKEFYRPGLLGRILSGGQPK